MELTTAGKDEETLSEVEAILKPVKNQIWPCVIQQS
jgi:L-galactose dehydrogenase